MDNPCRVKVTHAFPGLGEAHAASVLVHGLQAVARGRRQEDHVGHKLGGADNADGGRTAVQQTRPARLGDAPQGLQLGAVELATRLAELGSKAPWQRNIKSVNFRQVKMITCNNACLKLTTWSRILLMPQPGSQMLSDEAGIWYWLIDTCNASNRNPANVDFIINIVL